MFEENPQDLCRLLLLLIFHEKKQMEKINRMQNTLGYIKGSFDLNFQG